jgi:diguanylate cyclase (GGDEF)-like protein
MAAVMLLDVDGFKDVNDTLGHDIGDEVLKEIGPRLEGVTRDVDVVARLGGDEFAVLVAEIDGVETVGVVADRLLGAFAETFAVLDLRLHVDISVGVALFPADGTDAVALLGRADVAMYVAKGERSRIERYSVERDLHSRRRLELLGDLRGAIGGGQLTLHYQPVVELDTGHFVAVEALVRWEHPTLGRLPPIEFIPLAERTGLIGPLTEEVLGAAIAQTARWRAAGIHVRVGVNLSVRNLTDTELPGLVSRLLKDAGLGADCLDLEITESILMADPGRAMAVLEPLSDMGVRLAIDDFGTGYSSLAYLRQLPLSVLKIDRAFIGNMTTSDNDRIIVRSTIELAHNLGLEVIAEGVEDAPTAAALAALGCGLAQGYHFSRPVPAVELADRLHRPASHTGQPV